MSIHVTSAANNIKQQINLNLIDRGNSEQTKNRKKKMSNPKQQYQSLPPSFQKVDGDDIFRSNKRQLQIASNPNKVDDNIKQQKSSGELRKDRLKNKMSFIINTINQSNQVPSVSYCSQKSVHDEISGTSLSGSSDLRSQDNNANNKKERIQNINQRHAQHFVRKKDQEEFKDPQKIKKKIGYKYLFYSQIKEEIQQVEPIMQNNKKQAQQKIVQMPEPNIDSQINAYTYEKSNHKKDESSHTRLKSKLGFLINLINDSDQIGSVSYYDDSLRNTEKGQEKIQNDGQLDNAKKIDEGVIFNQSERFNSSKVNTEKNKNERQQFIQQIEAIKIRKNQKEKDQNNTQQKEAIKIIKGQKGKKEKDTQEKKAIIDLDKFKRVKSDSFQKRQEDSIKEYDSAKIQKQKLSIKSDRNHLSRQFQRINNGQKDKYLNMHNPLNRESKSVNNYYSPQRYQEQGSQVQNSSIKIVSALNAKSKQDQLQNQKNYMVIKVNSNNNLSSQDSNFSIKLHEIQMGQRKSRQRPIEQRQAKRQLVQIDQPIIKKKASEHIRKAVGLQIFKQIDKNNDYKTLSLHQNKSSYLQENYTNQKKFKTQNLQLSSDKNENENGRDLQIEQNINYLIPKNKIQFRLENKRKLQTQIKQKISDLRELTGQEKKIATLLKKRQQNLAKRVKQLFFPNNALFPSESSNSTKKERHFLPQNDALDSILDHQPRFGTTMFNEKKINDHKKKSLHGQATTKYQQLKDRPHFPTLNLSPNTKQSQNLFETLKHKRISNDKTKLNFISNLKKRGENDNIQKASERGVSAVSEQKQQMKKVLKQGVSKIQLYNINKLHKDYSNQSKRNLNARQKYERLKQLLDQI